MEPSALPAFSPPSGVRSLPRRLASAAEMPAAALSPKKREPKRESRRIFVFMG
jgi:hypothetical protein